MRENIRKLSIYACKYAKYAFMDKNVKICGIKLAYFDSPSSNS